MELVFPPPFLSVILCLIRIFGGKVEEEEGGGGSRREEQWSDGLSDYRYHAAGPRFFLRSWGSVSPLL